LRLGLVIFALTVATPPARADAIDDQVAQGERLGREGSWTQAIDHFKAADKLAPRAKHACLIGLAYSRRELWAEAELFFDLCHQRATPGDPTPDWLPDAETQLATKLAAANAAPVTLRVLPVEATARIAVSSFAPDETFAPRTIHLAPGAHVVTVTAPGYDTIKRELVIAPTQPREVVIELHRPWPRSRGPRYAWTVGGVLGLTALLWDVTAVRSARADLDAKYQYTYDVGIDRYQTRRDIDVALVGAAAVAVAVGFVLRALDKPPPVKIDAEVNHGGAAVMLEWSR
jgi:hypothetical protein